MNLTLKQISQITNSEIIGDENFVVTGLAFVNDAKEGDLVLAGNEKYFKQASESNASVILSKELFFETEKTVLISQDPNKSFIQLLNEIFVPNSFNERNDSIDKTAKVPSSAKIAKNATVGENTYIGENTIVHSGAYIGANCKIGDNCVIYPNVVIYDRTLIGNKVIIHANTTIGADGFGYESCATGLLKLPHTGYVEISDEVEIGSNTCIDRAKIGKTYIGFSTKIDNLCQIAHNVHIGKFSIICGQTGIAGSSKVGDMCLVGAQVGVADHVEIDNNCIIGAKTGVSKYLAPNSVIMGNPSHPVERARRIEALKNRLPETHAEFKQMKKQLEDILEEINEIQKKI